MIPRAQLTLAAALAVLSACTQAAPTTPNAQASLAPNGIVTRCPGSLGTLTIDDGRRENWWGAFFSETRISTIEPLIRLVIQQSNCFQIVTIGSMDLEGATNRIRNQERRAETMPGIIQPVAADYFLQPAILFANASTGSIGTVAGFLPFGGLVNGLVGGLSQNNTAVTMTLFDLRSGVQIADSEASASASSIGGAIASMGGPGASTGTATLAPYQRSAAGQTTVASFVEAYDKLVQSVVKLKAGAPRQPPI